MNSPPDDFRRLLDEVQNGSEDAARELVERYGPHIIRAVRRRLTSAVRSKFDSIDFVQAVWASFFASPAPLTKFNSPADLVRYLAALAQHKVVDEIRRRLQTQKYNVNRERSLDDSTYDLGDKLLAPQPTPSQVAAAKDWWARLLKDKPEHYRRVVQLRREGNTFWQIAEKTGLSEKTVRRILQDVLAEPDG